MTNTERLFNLEPRHYKHYKFMRRVMILAGIICCMTIVLIPFGAAFFVKAKSLRIQQESYPTTERNESGT